MTCKCGEGRIEAGFPSPTTPDAWLVICPACGFKGKVRRAVFGEFLLDGMLTAAEATRAWFVAAFLRVFGGGL
jgi:hypothetical protein